MSRTLLGNRPYKIFRNEFKVKHPHLVSQFSPVELAKLIGKRWREMTPDMKWPYIVSAQDSQGKEKIIVASQIL